MKKEEVKSHIAIRDMKEEDAAFIFDSWIKHMWSFSFLNGKMPYKLFRSYHQCEIEEMLNCYKVAIACDKNDEDEIIGYKVFADGSLEVFCYVKQAFRPFGIEPLINLEEEEYATES